ncbi:MAG: TonB-dependent receptor [Pseudomonadales bacterium]
MKALPGAGWVGVGAWCAALALVPPVAVAAEAIEEVIVTGSYIKRDSFDSSSPLTVIDSEAISANATPNLGEVLVAQTFNYGSDYQTNTYAARGQGGTTTTANLRGLGFRATLSLVDGKRLNFAPNASAGANLNNAIPQVAIERIDVLKDGASALYGTDAVAGVVNIITKKNFEGMKFSAFHTQDQDNDFNEQLYEVILGTRTDRGHFAIAASYRDRGELEQIDRPEFLRRGFERSGTGNPGDWLVPERDATGALTGTAARQVDPGCGAFDGSGRDVGVKNNWRSGDRSGSNCRLHFGEFWNFMNPVDQASVWMNFSYDFSDSVSNEVQLIYSRLDTLSRGSPQNPGGRTEEFPIVLGDHPGNPFRALADSNGDGVLEPLFAQDADADGIPDRGTADANGDGVPDVILAANPFDPASGVPFNEDVDVVALRIFGKLGAKPTSFFADGANSGNATFEESEFRIVDTLTVSIPDTSWEVSGVAVYDRIERVFEQKNTSQAALVQGLLGELKATPIDSTASYWNPFSTQELSCVNRVCSNTGTADFANTQEVVDAINIQANDVLESEFFNFEVVATGDLLELPAGTLAGAFGAQYRKTDWNVDLNAAQNQCDWHEGGCGFDYDANQDVWAAFFELAVPVFDTENYGAMELQLAARYEDYGGDIGDDFNPKIAALWQPYEWMSVRGSWSSAFIAPTLEDLFEPEDCGLETASDPLTGDLSQSFRVACVAGNPGLQPETADVWNVGVSFSLLDGDLNLGVDYASFDFTDRIAQTTMNQVLSRDFQNFLDSGGNPANPADVTAWINGPNSDPAIQRDVTGVITRVTTSLLNAQTMKHKAYDFYGNYTLSTQGFGTYRVGLDATLVDEYFYDLGFGIPPGDGVGKQNEDVAEVPPIPEWRVTGTLNWFMGNHAAFVRLRWMDSVEIDFNSKALQAAQLAINGTDEIEDMLYTDIQYSYAFQGLFGQDRETLLEIGGRNVFDEFPEPIFNLGGIESFLHDIRGRTWYLRVTQDL